MVEPFDLDMVEPNPPIKSKRGRKKKDDTPVITQGNPNDSEVEDRYPKRSRISKFWMFSLFLNYLF